MILTGHGIRVDLPDGWEGRIYRRPEGDPTLHAANFALPPDDGDFGTGATSAMADDGVFIALTEYDPALAGRGLFSRSGAPASLRARDPNPKGLLRTRPGQSGVQRFFSASGRAFCLYVVVGNRPTPGTLVAQANRVLNSLHIEHRPEDRA